MRCKNHSTDLSSIVGVCASCLRERLFRLVVAQEQIQAQSLEQNPMLRLSVYPTCRKSINSLNPVATVQTPFNKSRLNHSISEKRFFNSPQIAINTGGCIGGSSSNRKQTLIRFPSISSLFRSNSRNGDANSSHREPSSSSVTSSPSWFSKVVPDGGVRQKNRAGVVRNQRSVRDRGMSPVRSAGDDDLSDRSTYQSPESCKQTPSQPAVRQGGGRKSVTELIFCPMVRASPNRLLNVKGKPPVDGEFPGKIRAPSPAVPHLAYAKSFTANRSRKIADFGRSDNR